VADTPPMTKPAGVVLGWLIVRVQVVATKRDACIDEQQGPVQGFSDCKETSPLSPPGPSADKGG
jgi:hypothetical protein